MRHTIITTVSNSPSGVPGNFDGVAMLICQGVVTSAGTITGGVVLDTAYLCSQLSDVTDVLGITEDYDKWKGLAVYQQASEFYAEAGDGAYLWLVVTATTTAYATYCLSTSGTTFQNNIRGTIGNDTDMRVKLIGLCYKPPTSTQSATDFAADALAAIHVVEVTEKLLAQEGFPFVAVIDGANMSSTVTTATIGSMVPYSSPQIGFCITGSQPNGVSSVGALLGRIARLSVGHGIGATADGPITLTKSYLTNGIEANITGTTISQGSNMTLGHSYMVVIGPVTYGGNTYTFGQILISGATLTFTGTGTVVVDIVSTNTGTIIAGDKYLVLAGPIVSNSLTYTTGQVFTASTTTFYGGIVSLINSTDVTKLFLTDYENLGDKQYLFHCPYYQLPGLYWNDGATCDQSIDPLSCIEFNRVANKEVANLLSFLALMKGMNVPIDTKTGLVSYSFTHAKEADFASAYIDPLVVSNDISGGNLSLIGTPNGVNTVNWTYVLTINGEPITGNATGTVVFSNS